MTDTKMLVGSLSNDLFRVASLTQRGSHAAAERFLVEAKKWAGLLHDKEIKMYVKKIVEDIHSDTEELTIAKAEKLLMYGILLQNYSLNLN